MPDTLDHLIDDICSPEPARVAAALQTAAPHREALTPVLLARLQQASVEPDRWTGGEQPSPVFLPYLAAAWQLTDAHPLIVALLRLPSKQCDAMLGDFITEGARLTLADTWTGDLRALDALAFDTQADPFARGAALNTVALLTARARLPRADALAFLERVAASPFDSAKSDDVIAATEVVSALMDLQAWELRGTVTKLFERDLVDYSCVGDEDAVFAELNPRITFDPHNYRFPPPITDAWEEVRDWWFFDELHPGRRQWPPHSKLKSAVPVPTPPAADAPWSPPQPYVAPPKVGRNDPCPCGSGKKYKKCCGA